MFRVLVVDDHAPTVAALAELLSREGFEVLAYTSAVEARDALRRAAFDVVITDLEMPHVNGEEIIGTCVGHQPGACVVLASAGMRRTAPASPAPGACMVLSKPINYPVLLEKLATCRRIRGETCDGRCPLPRSHIVE